MIPCEATPCHHGNGTLPMTSIYLCAPLLSCPHVPPWNNPPLIFLVLFFITCFLKKYRILNYIYILCLNKVLVSAVLELYKCIILGNSPHYCQQHYHHYYYYLYQYYLKTGTHYVAQAVSNLLG